MGWNLFKFRVEGDLITFYFYQNWLSCSIAMACTQNNSYPPPYHRSLRTYHLSAIDYHPAPRVLQVPVEVFCSVTYKSIFAEAEQNQGLSDVSPSRSSRSSTGSQVENPSEIRHLAVGTESEVSVCNRRRFNRDQRVPEGVRAKAQQGERYVFQQ